LASEKAVCAKTEVPRQQSARSKEENNFIDYVLYGDSSEVGYKKENVGSSQIDPKSDDLIALVILKYEVLKGLVYNLMPFSTLVQCNISLLT
jgi:hypothetical protein